MLALTLCRSGADSDWYPSRTTDTCDGVTRRLVPCAPRGATKGLILRSKNLVPSALEKALEDHQSLLQQYQLFAASNGSLSEEVWLAKSPSERIILWLRQAMREMNVVVFAAQDLQAALSFKQTPDIPVAALVRCLQI